MRIAILAVAFLMVAGVLAFEGIAESSLGTGIVTQDAAAECIENPIGDGCLPCPHLPHAECTM